MNPMELGGTLAMRIADFERPIDPVRFRPTGRCRYLAGHPTSDADDLDKDSQSLDPKATQQAVLGHC